MDSNVSEFAHVPSRERPLVYVGMCCDPLHHGHIALLVRARALGRVIVGLLTDEAIAIYKGTPLLSYAERQTVVAEIRGVDTVVPQRTLSYRDNLLAFRPSFVVHGDDWRKGVQEATRQEVIDLLTSWNGTLVEVPYTQGCSSRALRARIRSDVER
jgi:phosphoenolpyruvate phosphomutase